MPKYKENEKVTLNKINYLKNHPELFAVLVWENCKCIIKIEHVTKDEYIFIHKSNIIKVHRSLLDDPISCKSNYIFYNGKKMTYDYNRGLIDFK